MKIKDEKHGINIQVETHLSTTSFELSYFEMAAAIGQFIAEHDITEQDFLNRFFHDAVNE